MDTNSIDYIYNSQDIINLDPIKDKTEIFRLSDLNWNYEIVPLLYYNKNKELVISGSRQLLINRDQQQEEVAVRGKDFKIISANELYNVFISLQSTLNLSLYAIGHTRGGKFLYIVAEMDEEINSLNSLNLRKCLFIYTVNDGNGKTKFAPILLKKNENEYQLSVVGGEDNEGKPKYLSTCYEISHHYDFDGTEAINVVKESIQDHFNSFEEKIEIFKSITINIDHVEEFHHSMYHRFQIGNNKTKREYKTVTSELKAHFISFSKKLPYEYQDTLCGLYLSFVAYLDCEKKRKMGREGRITSINFTHDNVSKRAAFHEICKIASKSMKNNEG